MRILLVEDHADSASILTRVLVREGYAVDIAYDLKSAREHCSTKTYNLLITDIGLPDGSGLDLMKELLAACPIKGIVVSGYAYDTDIEKSLRAGFSAHVTKPIDVSDFLKTIRRVTASDNPNP